MGPEVPRGTITVVRRGGHFKPAAWRLRNAADPENPPRIVCDPRRTRVVGALVAAGVGGWEAEHLGLLARLTYGPVSILILPTGRHFFPLSPGGSA
jgi:hypothetical protein